MCKQSPRCPINGQPCEGCINNEPPADGPDPEMFKPASRDWDEDEFDWTARILPAGVLAIGTFGFI